MLNVSYKNIIGYCTEIQSIAGLEKKYRIAICHANCLCAFIWFNEKEGTATLANFLADNQHLKNIMKSNDFELVFGNWDNFVFNPDELDKDLWQMIKTFAGKGKTITLTTNDEYINSTKE